MVTGISRTGVTSQSDRQLLDGRRGRGLSFQNLGPFLTLGFGDLLDLADPVVDRENVGGKDCDILSGVERGSVDAGFRSQAKDDDPWFCEVGPIPSVHIKGDGERSPIREDEVVILDRLGDWIRVLNDH